MKKILIIDSDNFDYYRSTGYEDEIYPIFSEEIDNDTLEFYFVKDLLEASAQILLIEPNLIISEFVLTPVDLSSELVNISKKFGHGLKIFEILDRLNLLSIPVIFWSALGNEEEYIQQANKLGAFACIESKINSTEKLKKACYKALKIL